jgi:class 3 adenylate cyclase
MPIFMDVHKDLGDVTEQDIKVAHQRDLDIQDEYGVQFLTYWFNSPDGTAFCLVDAPTKEAAITVHKQSHGLVPHNMVEVEKPTVSRFMGDWEMNVPDIARNADSEVDSGLRAIMFTDLVGSTEVSTRDGDAKALELLGRHDRIVREALATNGGREVKHTGDGIFASFSYVSRAVECAQEIQRAFGEPAADASAAGRVRIGISAGEPVSQHEDLFGAAVNLASRICAHADPGQILVSSAVRELSVGKQMPFQDRGPIALKGFDDPVRLFEVPITGSAVS